jgi:hypothetical protein
MKKIKNNLYYFNFSKENPEELLDDYYVFDKKHQEIEKYIESTKNIKSILVKIKNNIDKKENIKVVDKYFEKLSNTLNKFSNCSEFSCFISACDNTLDSVKNDLNLLKEITKRYFEKRILNEFVPEEWIQTILDTNSSRKKGSCGEKKLIALLEKRGYKLVKNWNDFDENKKSAIKFSKSIDLKNVCNKLGIKIKTKKQGKKLDLIIKNNNRIFICEAKHINGSGGLQNKQISELIEILGLKERNENISYISFLDGNYSNIILSDIKNGKIIETQRKEIMDFLKKNPNNYWLNTAGFIKLFDDLKK